MENLHISKEAWMRGMSLLLVAATLAGCSTAPEQRSARAEDQLRRALDGKVAQAAVPCLPRSRSGDMTVIDDNTILFREGRTVYRNDLNGGRCGGLGAGNTLLTRQHGQLCRGDIAEVINISTGTTTGSCVIGDFVPYRAPRG
jgi:hypothetical protein